MKSSVVITFEGLNVNRILNAVCKTAPIYSVERSGKICSLETSCAYLKQIVALLEDRCYNITNIRYKGARSVWEFIKARFVIAICLAFCIFAVGVCSTRCLKISVSGDFGEETVLTSLSELGVMRGAPISEINVDELENALANKLGAMYAVVNRKGSVLYVNAVSKKDIDEPIDLRKRRDIVSRFSGKVSKIVCEQGNALVKVGDTVNVGDVLIEGKRIYNDGTSEDVYALGKVFLELTCSAFAEFNGTKTSSVRTGEAERSVKAVLFGKEYGKNCSYESFEEEYESKYLFPLNLELRTYTFYETKKVTVPANVSECREELKERAFKQAKAECGFEIIREEYDERENGTAVTLYGYAEIT